MNRQSNLRIRAIFSLISMSWMLTSCSTIPQKRYAIDPGSKEFLSKTRYTITKQEKDIFYSTPPEKRKEFVDEFW